MHNINNNAVQGCLSENFNTKKLIIARNILDTKYSQFEVVDWYATSLIIMTILMLLARKKLRG